MGDTTTAYYAKNAQGFFTETVAVDMEPLYERFLPRLPAGGHILDAGCGSGRDCRAFIQRGYRVTAFDASPELARLARRHIGQDVLVMRLEEMDWQQTFDGIWACASLLHVPAAGLAEVMARLARALKPGGILYASFKHGPGEREHDGRRFTDLDESGLNALIAQVSSLSLIETWVTGDLRPGRGDQPWLNTLLIAG